MTDMTLEQRSMLALNRLPHAEYREFLKLHNEMLAEIDRLRAELSAMKSLVPRPKKEVVFAWTKAENVARLGTVADAVLAKELGISISAVYKARKSRGIPAKYAGSGGLWLWDDIRISSMLGTCPDAELGRRLGVSRNAVRAARMRRGIKKFEG